MIESIGGDGRVYQLLDEQGRPAALNGYYASSGLSYKLEGGRAPRHGGSSGHVWVRPDGLSQFEMYPQVFGLKWVAV